MLSLTGDVEMYNLAVVSPFSALQACCSDSREIHQKGNYFITTMFILIYIHMLYGLRLDVCF